MKRSATRAFVGSVAVLVFSLPAYPAPPASPASPAHPAPPASPAAQIPFTQAKADHDFREQETELKSNTELTRMIHVLTQELHQKVCGAQPAGG
jgi:hypothetical protein